MDDKDLEKLVFGMAHQVRNPCAIILSNANILLQNPKLTPEARRSLESIVNGVKYLESRLDEFVEFSKPLILKPKITSLYQLLDSVVSLVREKSQLQRIKISCNVDRALTLQKADQNQLLLALLNVVLNAIESIREGGVVTIDATQVKESVLIVIKDTGCGIHPRDLPEVFSPFYSTKADGIGIGLTVSKRIIEAHKGKIEVTSRQNEGSTVAVQLPLS